METGIENLHCFDNGELTVVAASVEEISGHLEEWAGLQRKDFDDEEDWQDACNFYKIPDDRILTIYVEDELKVKPDGVEIDGFVWKATAKAWAQSQKKGFLCAEEY